MNVKSKIKSALNHPAAGLVTVVAVNSAILVVSYVVSKKLEAKIETAVE